MVDFAQTPAMAGPILVIALLGRLGLTLIIVRWARDSNSYVRIRLFLIYAVEGDFRINPEGSDRALSEPRGVDICRRKHPTK
jgi:hypothetical protein